MSILNDVKMSIREANKIGMPKHIARENEQKYIHSYNQLDKCNKIGREFANFVRDNYDVKKLFKANETHYRAFLETKKDTTKGHRRNIETALKLVESGMQARAERYNKTPTSFSTEERLIPTAERTENVTDRSYSDKEINDIKALTSENTTKAINLMSNLGLRVGETANAKVNHIDFEKGVFHIIGGKGGKDREIPIKSDFLNELESMTHNKDGADNLVSTNATVISNDCKNAAYKLNIENWNGTHGFRHTYARKEVNEKLTNAEKQMFDKCLTNYSEGKPFNYAIREHEKETYNKMKSKMDQVHHNLGHGKNRFDLALRYMG